MKNIKATKSFTRIIGIITFTLILSACNKKWLDLEPQDRVSEDAVWSNRHELDRLRAVTDAEQKA